MYNNQMRRAMDPSNFQGMLNSLSNRNILNSDIAADAFAGAGSNVAKSIADKAFEAQVAQSQAQMSVPGILAGLASLGQESSGLGYGSSFGQSAGQSQGTSAGSSYGQSGSQSQGQSSGQSSGSSYGQSSGSSSGSSGGQSNSSSSGSGSGSSNNSSFSNDPLGPYRLMADLMMYQPAV